VVNDEKLILATKLQYATQYGKHQNGVILQSVFFKGVARSNVDGETDGRLQLYCTKRILPLDCTS
jgi:hypothetical protein